MVVRQAEDNDIDAQDQEMEMEKVRLWRVLGTFLGHLCTFNLFFCKEWFVFYLFAGNEREQKG